MDEFFPILLAFVLGSLILRISKGPLRIFLSAASVLTAALLASCLTGEIFRSSLYLLIDLVEAAAGFAVAITCLSVLSRRKAPSKPA
jgi:hypothetical protein